jgi:hypothetical protein
MVLEVLDTNFTKSPAEFRRLFRQELFTALTHYYEQILNQDPKMPFSDGSPKSKSFKRKFAALVPAQAPPAQAAGEDPAHPGSGEKDSEEDLLQRTHRPPRRRQLQILERASAAPRLSRSG